jgi:hypothetical protein
MRHGAKMNVGKKKMESLLVTHFVQINLVFMKYSSFSRTIATLVELYLWRYYGEERSAGGFEYFFETNNFLRMKYFAE